MRYVLFTHCACVSLRFSITIAIRLLSNTLVPYQCWTNILILSMSLSEFVFSRLVKKISRIYSHPLLIHIPLCSCLCLCFCPFPSVILVIFHAHSLYLHRSFSINISPFLLLVESLSSPFHNWLFTVTLFSPLTPSMFIHSNAIFSRCTLCAIQLHH